MARQEVSLNIRSCLTQDPGSMRSKLNAIVPNLATDPVVAKRQDLIEELTKLFNNTSPTFTFEEFQQRQTELGARKVQLTSVSLTDDDSCAKIIKYYIQCPEGSDKERILYDLITNEEYQKCCGNEGTIREVFFGIWRKPIGVDLYKKPRSELTGYLNCCNISSAKDFILREAAEDQKVEEVAVVFNLGISSNNVATQGSSGSVGSNDVALDNKVIQGSSGSCAWLAWWGALFKCIYDWIKVLTCCRPSSGISEFKLR